VVQPYNIFLVEEVVVLLDHVDEMDVPILDLLKVDHLEEDVVCEPKILYSLQLLQVFFEVTCHRRRSLVGVLLKKKVHSMKK